VPTKPTDRVRHGAEQPSASALPLPEAKSISRPYTEHFAKTIEIEAALGRDVVQASGLYPDVK
jgi:hypothetical protein